MNVNNNNKYKVIINNIDNLCTLSLFKVGGEVMANQL